MTPRREGGQARPAAASHLSEGAAAEAGARGAVDTRGKEGGGRVRFIIGGGGGHL